MSQKLDVLSKYPDAVELGELYRQAGFDLYLVGGLVRDELRNTPGEFTDFDMTTNATPAQSERILSAWGEHIWDIGKEYGTISARKNGAVYEVTTYRAEVYVADSRKPTVEFGTDLKADLIRRDFTINAMAAALPSGEIVDLFHGTKDLAEGVLRTPRSPQESFSEDPLRMMRAARFAGSIRSDAADGTAHRDYFGGTGARRTHQTHLCRLPARGPELARRNRACGLCSPGAARPAHGNGPFTPP